MKGVNSLESLSEARKRRNPELKLTASDTPGRIKFHEFSELELKVCLLSIRKDNGTQCADIILHFQSYLHLRPW